MLNTILKYLLFVCITNKPDFMFLIIKANLIVLISSFFFFFGCVINVLFLDGDELRMSSSSLFQSVRTTGDACSFNCSLLHGAPPFIWVFL